MKQVSSETIDKALDWLESLGDGAEMENLIDTFGDQQPLLLAYLMSVGEEDLREEEQDILLYLGICFWKSLEMEKNQIEEVTEAKLEAIRTENLNLLEAAESGQGKDFDRVWLEVTEDYSQPHLLALILESILEEEGLALRNQNRNAVQSYAKIALDSLL